MGAGTCDICWRCEFCEALIKMMAAMLFSMVCSQMFSLTIKHCTHQRKEVRKYANILLSNTFVDVLQSHHGPDEWYEVDAQTILFNIIELFPIKNIKFLCLKQADGECVQIHKEPVDMAQC